MSLGSMESEPLPLIKAVNTPSLYIGEDVLKHNGATIEEGCNLSSKQITYLQGNTWLNAGAYIAAGCTVMAGCTIGIPLGRECYIGNLCKLLDGRIGQYTIVGDRCTVEQIIGEKCKIGANCFILGVVHDDCIIGEWCWIRVGAFVGKGGRIGNGCDIRAPVGVGCSIGNNVTILEGGPLPERTRIEDGAIVKVINGKVNYFLV